VLVDNNERHGSAWSDVRDCLTSLFVFAWFVFLLCAFVVLPDVVTMILGPGWGLLVALMAFPVWARWGARPCPGLLDGLICISGYFEIIAIVVVHLILFVQSIFR